MCNGSDSLHTQVLDAKERGHRPKDRSRQNLLGMGGRFFFLGLPSRQCVCLSSCRGHGSPGSLFARCPGPSVALSSVALSLGAFGVLFLLVGAVPEGYILQLARRFLRRSGSVHHKHRVGGTHGRDGSDGWRSPVPRGQYWGARSCTSSANHRLQVPPTDSEHRDGSFCGQCTRWVVLYFLDGCGVAASFWPAVAAAIWS